MAKSERGYIAPLLLGAAAVLAVGWLLLGRDDDTTVPNYCQLANGEGRTLSAGEVGVIVARVRQALYGSAWTEDEPGVIDALRLCRSNADLFAVACTFSEWAPWWISDRDLFQAVREYFDADELDELNAALLASGVTVQF